MEELPKIEHKEKLINKFEIVLFDEGSPRETIDIRIDNKSDSGFFFGVGRFLKTVPLEELQRIFPYLVDSTQEGQPKINTKNLRRIVNDSDGLQELSNRLGVPVEIVKKSRGKIVDQTTINPG